MIPDRLLAKLGTSCLIIGACTIAACASNNSDSRAQAGQPSASAGSTGNTSGGAPGTSGAPDTNGTSGAPSAGGETSSGGAVSAGGYGDISSGGNSATGGTATGGTATGGTATSAAGAGPGGDRWGGLKNPPVRSAGCGKPAGITTGIKTIMSGGTSRDYAIDVPDTYDQNKPNVVVFGYHYSGGSASVIKGSQYYHMQGLATADNIPTIFIAPNHSASQADHAVFLDILAYVEANLCVDTTRVFAMGYSLGAMMSYSLSTNHQDKLRAVATIEAANFNVWLPNPKLKEPIAYMGITGMADTLCMWDGGPGKGAKYIALEKAADNGCTVPAGDNIPTWTSANHFTYEFQGCKTDYPLVVPTFSGPHGGAEVAKDPGSSSSWVPKDIWEFFKRF